MPETEYRILTAKYDGACAKCGASLPAGTKIRYYPDSKKAYCEGDHKAQQEGRPDDFPPDEAESPEPASPTPEWGYREKDRLMCRESCAKSAVAIFAASIGAGIYKTHPDVSAITAYAGALEKWCLEAVD